MSWSHLAAVLVQQQVELRKGEADDEYKSLSPPAAAAAAAAELRAEEM